MVLVLLWHLGFVYAIWDVQLLKTEGSVDAVADDDGGGEGSFVAVAPQSSTAPTRATQNKSSAWPIRIVFLFFGWPLWLIAPGMPLLFEPFLTDLTLLSDKIQAFSNRFFFVANGVSLWDSLVGRDKRSQADLPGFQL